jgi:hypothetical protein
MRGSSCMGRLFIAVLTMLLSAVQLQAQTPPAATPAKPAPDATQLAVDWVDRMNNLSNWYLTMDGKEDEADKVVDHMMEAFAPDAIVQVPPHDEEQLGPVVLVGSDQVRKWVDKVARSQVHINYKIQRQTQDKADGEIMVHSKPLPWGGVSIAFQTHAAYSLREDRRRFLELGALFIEYGDDGKIHRLRLFLEEKDEVVDSPENEI